MFSEAAEPAPSKIFKNASKKCDCRPCKPGPDLLFGQGRERNISHDFEVDDCFVQVCMFSNECPDAMVCIEQVVKVCGQRQYRPAPVACGEPVVSNECPTKVLHLSGTYRARLMNACPDEVTVTQTKVKTPANANAC